MSTHSPFTIRPVEDQQDLEDIAKLFHEYAAWIGIDLSFQGFQAELAELPGEYGRVSGVLLIAKVNDQTAGCVALRKFRGDTCEMKRMFVREPFRRSGLGRLMADRLIESARSRGYRSMLLDTLRGMTPALSLYKSLGFVEVDAYYDNPLDDAVYLKLELD